MSLLLKGDRIQLQVKLVSTGGGKVLLRIGNSLTLVDNLANPHLLQDKLYVNIEAVVEEESDISCGDENFYYTLFRLPQFGNVVIVLKNTDVRLANRTFAVNDKVVPLKKVQKLSSPWGPFLIGAIKSLPTEQGGKISVCFASRSVRGHTITVDFDETDLRPATDEEHRMDWANIQRR